MGGYLFCTNHRSGHVHHHFQLAFRLCAHSNTVLRTYKRKTKKDPASQPLLLSLQVCDFAEAILAVLREQISAFSRFTNGDDRLTKWVTPTVNALYSFSAKIGGGVGLVSIGMFHEEFQL